MGVTFHDAEHAVVIPEHGPGGIVTCRLEDETVLYGLERGLLYSLDCMILMPCGGAALWNCVISDPGGDWGAMVRF